MDEKELERYARHILLPEIGGAGQARLLGAKVLVIGAGGLGSPVILYLAAAGVGTIGIVDDDAVDLSNLQRQIVHATERIGDAKTSSAAAAVAAINPGVTVVPITERLNAGNATRIIADYDIIADGSDNFETRFLVNDACFLAK
jgi:adenylyltransferase/sulfurtransferase